jgi:hypothetical protein
LVLADEVGTGKTRIACALVQAVVEAGGRAAVVVPRGLMHQWRQEARKLMAEGAIPKELTSLAEFRWRAWETSDDEWAEHAPHPDNAEWWLISHTFRSSQVRKGRYPAEWRLALPSYVRAALSSAARRNDGRTQLGRLLAYPDKIVLRISLQIASQIEAKEERHKMRARLDRLPAFQRGGDNRKLVAVLRGDGEGRRLVEDLLGLWLGKFDLVIIDEAHKGRDEADVQGTALGAAPTKVLARLIDTVLKQPVNGRRLCLTATPMELRLDQWLDLLVRARCGIDRKHGPERKAIDRLHTAVESAAIAPDEEARLTELCSAAKEFQCALAPYVTRRRRDDDPAIRDFRVRARLNDGIPHPHRKLEQVRIDWSETDLTGSPWMEILFAAECMSQAARGLSHANTEGWPRAIRDAYTKLSAGHVSIDLSDADGVVRLPAQDECDDYTRGKITRVGYWYRRLRQARQKVVVNGDNLPASDDDVDAEHPRILGAIKEIERWTLQNEKVLVFGVFLRPLRLLRDVLNVRHALRAADAGRPVAQALHTDQSLLAIAERQAAMLRKDGAISGRLLDNHKLAIPHALRDSHKAYERLRRQVREGVERSLTPWRDDPFLLGGAGAELRGAVHDHLVSFVLDDFLSSTTASERPTRERIQELAADFLKHHLRPLLDELEQDEDDDENRIQLRREALRRAFLDDQNTRQRPHAWLLHGDTSWDTRKYVQAAFNRHASSPWVLIAQTQVGREGLNLHEACRVVVQFHAEWNPAILEQQIGRVDRKGSRWEHLARKWLDAGQEGVPPYVEVRQLLFEGTYDAFQWERVIRRQRMFDASLFGALLPAEAWQRVPKDRIASLIEAAPSFTP